MSDNKFDFKMPDFSFMKDIQIPATPPTEELFLYYIDHDCPAVEKCPYPRSYCYTGNHHISEKRCTGAAIEGVLREYSNNISITGDNNNLINGDNNTQSIQNEIPLELIIEITRLLKEENTDKQGWIDVLSKLSSLTPALAQLGQFISNL